MVNEGIMVAWFVLTGLSLAFVGVDIPKTPESTVMIKRLKQCPTFPEHSRRDLQHLLPPAPSPQTAQLQRASNHIVRRLAKCERGGLTLAPGWPSCEMRRLM